MTERTYSTAEGRQIVERELVLAASAARTATANGSDVDPEDLVVATVTLDVTASSGTSPTLDVTIQAKDKDGNWVDVVSFTQATGTTTERKAIPLPGRKVRAKWTVGGSSPSFTFSVIAQARR